MTSQCYTTARHAHSRGGVGRAGALTARDLGHVSLFVRDLEATRRFDRERPSPRGGAGVLLVHARVTATSTQ
jgi:hypothetical protein